MANPRVEGGKSSLFMRDGAENARSAGLESWAAPLKQRISPIRRAQAGNSRVNLDRATRIAAELEDKALAHKLTEGR